MCVQVSILDVSDAAGRVFKETLDKEYGAEKTLFFHCNVESEQQVKGNAHAHVSLTTKVGQSSYPGVETLEGNK